MALQGDEKGYYVSQWINKDANKGGLEKCIEKRRINSNEVYLRVKVNEPNALCNFSFSEDGIIFLPIGIDFYAEPVLWSGSRVGIFCISDPRYRIGGYADFDWFRIDK